MKKEKLNGKDIPYDDPIDVLIQKLNSHHMGDFSLACEALSYKKEPEAFFALKEFICNKDVYRKRYVLETIFRHSMAISVLPKIEEMLKTSDRLITETIMLSMIQYNLTVKDDTVFNVLDRLGSELSSLALSITKHLSISDYNYNKLLSLFQSACYNLSQKTVIAEALYSYAELSDDHFMKLFDLFSINKSSHIRMLAVNLAKKKTAQICLIDFLMIQMDISKKHVTLDINLRPTSQKSS